MLEPDQTVGIDQHVASLLPGVGARQAGKPPESGLTKVGAEGRRPPQVPEPGLPHRVGVIEAALGVDEQRPAQPGLGHVRTSRGRILERHGQRLHPEPRKILLRLLQLQQMPPAGQSEQVPVEHQQQPPAAVSVEPVHPTVRIGQLERSRWTADER